MITGEMPRRCAIMFGVKLRFLGISELSEAAPVVVVVDVMRAFTTAAWAFALGAEKIVFADSIGEALALKARCPDWLALKDGPPAAGFDLVNSPCLLHQVDVAGRTIVQKTTAGTVGALAAKDAALVLCASFVVAQPTAQLLQDVNPEDVTFLVTGEDGQAEEDLACAQYIARIASGGLTEAAEFVRRAADSRAAAALAESVRREFKGVHAQDVPLCLQADRFAFAMVATLEESLMILHPHLPPGRAQQAYDH
jgi:2-phosphosulfolactate phosphatase